MGMTTWHWFAAEGKLWGRGLRHFLVSVLANASRPVSVGELVERVAAEPARLSGRPSKVISDALRWEVGRGRVRRERRGVYVFLRAPSSTRRWIERRARELRGLLARRASGDPATFVWSPSAQAFVVASP